VNEPVCAEVYQPGYRVGDRVLRPARVAVAEPQE
jgi:molecular chaperone GrpE